MEVDFSDKIKEIKKNFSTKSISICEASEIICSIIASKCEQHNDKHESKVSEEQLKKVYFRGSKSYDSAFRIGKTRTQWAMARVNLFLKMNRGEDVNDSYLISDKDILIDESQADPNQDIYSFDDFSDIELNLASLDLVKSGMEKWNQDFNFEDILYSEAEKKTLNKPFRLKDGKKKFGVYVKNPKTGNVILVKFGDPNMEIKRDDPDRRRSFRARHKCDSAKDKTTPRYWSCKMWSKKPVNKSVSSEAIEWDEEELLSEWGWDESSIIENEDYFRGYAHLENIENIIEEEDV
ncbi:MAG: hypothetical protein HWN81_02025 [Candidatus Lokiarchaeota archaeon]|nr:hypothetical protein [Candidatus Lokiarchaeota archaeon]